MNYEFLQEQEHNEIILAYEVIKNFCYFVFNAHNNTPKMTIKVPIIGPKIFHPLLELDPDFSTVGEEDEREKEEEEEEGRKEET